MLSVEDDVHTESPKPATMLMFQGPIRVAFKGMLVSGAQFKLEKDVLASEQADEYKRYIARIR